MKPAAMVRNLLILLAWVLSQAGFSVSPLQESVDLYHQAVGGKIELLPKAIDGLKAVLSRDEKNLLAKVYLGCAYTVKGRESWMPWEKINWVTRGVNLMDEAVAADPENFEVRKVRLFNNMHLPKMLGRDPIVAADQKFALDRFKRGLVSPTEQQAVLYEIGHYFHRQGKVARAKDYWQQAIERDRGSPLAAHAARDLQRLAL